MATLDFEELGDVSYADTSVKFFAVIRKTVLVRKLLT
jgi:hypothetical protein